MLRDAIYTEPRMQRASHPRFSLCRVEAQDAEEMHAVHAAPLPANGRFATWLLLRHLYLFVSGKVHL